MAPARRQTSILAKTAEHRQPLGMTFTSYFRSVDWILLLATVGVVIYGMVMLNSAAQSNPDGQPPSYYLSRQGTGLGLGLLVLFALSVFNYRWFARWQIYIYGASLFLLVLTLAIGSGADYAGSNRWLNFGLFKMQTAELVKFMVVLSLGAILAEGIELRHSFRFVLLCVLYVLIPGVLIFLQPDLGTALCLGAIFICMVVVLSLIHI